MAGASTGRWPGRHGVKARWLQGRQEEDSSGKGTGRERSLVKVFVTRRPSYPSVRKTGVARWVRLSVTSIYALVPQPQRQRTVRALLLYPMNALVNDQLGRLRVPSGGIGDANRGEPSRGLGLGRGHDGRGHGADFYPHAARQVAQAVLQASEPPGRMRHSVLSP